MTYILRCRESRMYLSSVIYQNVNPIEIHLHYSPLESSAYQFATKEDLYKFFDDSGLASDFEIIEREVH
jgi:hypothetical protein